MSEPVAKLIEKLDAQSAHVGIIGLGYVGLPLATTCAARGFRTTGFDIDPVKIDRLDRHDSYIDAVSDDTLKHLQADGHLSWTTEMTKLARMDVIVICVPTPLSKNRDPDLSFVRNTTKVIAEHITSGTLVVLESTTYPGTTEDVVKPILESNGLVCGRDFLLGFSPEREDPGNTAYATATIPKVVAGDGETATRAMTAFYGRVVDKVVPVSTTQTAEAVKISENIFRAVNIALVNELKVIFDALDIDVWEVIDAAATKPFGFMPFYPGPGLGGHCIPIDPFYLTWKAREHDLSTRFIELAGEINSNMPQHIVTRLREVIDQTCGIGLSKARILIVGLSYKKNVADVRESPSMRLMQILKDNGADIDFLDPLVPEVPLMRDYAGFQGKPGIVATNVTADRYDAILISTDHDLIDYAALVETGIPIVDTRNAIERRGLPMHSTTKA